jgi:hypothetical protein
MIDAGACRKTKTESTLTMTAEGGRSQLNINLGFRNRTPIRLGPRPARTAAARDAEGARRAQRRGGRPAAAAALSQFEPSGLSDTDTHWNKLGALVACNRVVESTNSHPLK